MNRWMAFPLLAGLLALWLSRSFLPGPLQSNDGIQYVDAAEHVRAGDCLCTTVAHFDEQVAHGRFPVPFTHFAPGYPLLIAGLSLLGANAESAGYFVSALSFLVTLWMMWKTGLWLGIRPLAMVLVSALWLTSYMALLFAAEVLADGPLTAAYCVTIGLVVKDIQTKGQSRFLPIGIGAAAAAAYWLKYAGMFVIPMAILYLLWRGWRQREGRFWTAAGIGAAILLALPIPIHNIVFEGSWRGGFHAGSSHYTAGAAIRETLKAIYHLVFGSRAVARLDLWAGLAILSLIVSVLLAFKKGRSGRPQLALMWIALFIGSFTCGVALASMQSIAADLLRYNLPIYPELLILATALIMPDQPAQMATFGALVLAVLMIQSRSLVATPSSTDSAGAILEEQLEPGLSIRQWVENHVSPKDVIVAVDGQASYYILKRPVISVIEPDATSRRTDEAGFESLMKQFHARYLLVYRNRPADTIPEQQAIPFLSDLASGTAPAWLKPAARVPDAAIFECVVCR